MTLFFQAPSRSMMRVALAVLVSQGVTGTASAQLIEGRPFKALVMTVSNPAESRNQIDVNAFVSAGHDEFRVTVLDIENRTDPRLSSGSFGALFLRSRYAHQGHRSAFGVDGGLTSRYYPTLGNLTVMDTFAGVNWATDVGERGRFRLSERFVHSPFLSYAYLPAAAAADDVEEQFEPATDQRTIRLATNTYDTQVGFEQQVGRHSYLAFNYVGRYADVTPATSASSASDLLSHRPAVRFRHEVGRYASFHVGYAFRKADYLESAYDPVVAHDVDLGVSYSRPLSFSRRTRVGFSAGSSFVETEGSRFFVNGSAFVRHAFTRTWNAVLSYYRGMDVREGFAAPFFFFSDTVTGRVTGRIADPLTLIAGASYYNGRFSVDSLENDYDSVSSYVALQVPIVTNIGATVQGYFTDYGFQQRVGLLTGAPIESRSFGLRVGLNLWVPVLR